MEILLKKYVKSVFSTMRYEITVIWKKFINLFILISNNKIVMIYELWWFNYWKMPYSSNGKLARNVPAVYEVGGGI